MRFMLVCGNCRFESHQIKGVAGVAWFVDKEDSLPHAWSYAEANASCPNPWLNGWQ